MSQYFCCIEQPVSMAVFKPLLSSISTPSFMKCNNASAVCTAIVGIKYADQLLWPCNLPEISTVRRKFSTPMSRLRDRSHRRSLEYFEVENFLNVDHTKLQSGSRFMLTNGPYIMWLTTSSFWQQTVISSDVPKTWCSCLVPSCLKTSNSGYINWNPAINSLTS